MIDLNDTQFAIVKSVAQGVTTASGIAEHTSISLPHVTTQLALLEAKDVLARGQAVTKGVPGKPKKHYMLKEKYVAVTLLREGFGAQSRLKRTTPAFEKYMQVILQIEPEKKDVFSTYYWSGRKHFDHVTGLGYLHVSHKKIEMVALTDTKHLDVLRKEISNQTVVDSSGKNVIVVCWVHTPEELKNGYGSGDEYYRRLVEDSKVLFDEEGVFTDIKERVIG